MRSSSTRLLEQHPIRPGSHPTRDDGLCAMEMVAWLAGEEHSDGPRCACPVTAAFVRAFNDALPDDDARERHLRRLLPRLVNSRGTGGDERARGLRIVDHATRTLAPRALELRGRAEAAATLRALPPIDDAVRAGQAALELKRHGQATRCAAWMAQQAAAGARPATWAGAVVRAARETAEAGIWTDLQALLERLLAPAPLSLPRPRRGSRPRTAATR